MGSRPATVYDSAGRGIYGNHQRRHGHPYQPRAPGLIASGSAVSAMLAANQHSLHDWQRASSRHSNQMSTDLDDDGLEYSAADLRPGRGTYPEGSRIAISDDADDPVHGAQTLMHSSDVNKSTAA